MTPGERRVFAFFDRHLPEEWEIYFEPHLNGLRPDFVLLNPNVGVAVFEVKDWKLSAMRRFVSSDRQGRPVLRAERDGEQFLEKNPVVQVNQYKQKLFNLYCPRLDAKLGWAAITAGVIFPEEAGARALELLVPFVQGPPAYQPISGGDALARGDLEAVFPTAARFSRSRLMTSEMATDLRGWLVEPDVSREQRRPLLDDLDRNQRQLATSRTESGFRRIRGPAGSGKSLVLAARAAALAEEGRSVLVVCFNITLRNYLRDMAQRGLTKASAARNIIFLHFHAWCFDMCERAGMEDQWRSLFADLPKNRTAYEQG